MAHAATSHSTKLSEVLDDETSNKLERLTQAFGRSAAEVIRQLIAQASPVDFPPSWQVRAGDDR
jgi:predicted transcriptional regulator